MSFHDAADELVIESELLLRCCGLDEPLARIARSAGAYPLEYDTDERIIPSRTLIRGATTRFTMG